MVNKQPEALRLADLLTDSHLPVHHKAAAELRRLHAENEALRTDAECFRFWVREAACAPGDMARLIMKCVTEQDYRDAIIPAISAARAAIAKATGETK